MKILIIIQLLSFILKDLFRGLIGIIFIITFNNLWLTETTMVILLLYYIFFLITTHREWLCSLLDNKPLDDMCEDVWLHYGLRWLVLAVLCHTSCHSCRRRLARGWRGHGRCHRCSRGVTRRLHRAWRQRNKASTHHHSNHNNISSTNVSGKSLEKDCCWK